MWLLLYTTICLANTSCVHASTEARYRGYGYDHLVHLASACKQVAECDVSTNINPKPQTVTVRPASKVTVITFRGSAARTFTPKITCRLRP